MKECSHLNCDLEVFENNNKCIFHCTKDDWFITNEKNIKIWNEKRVNKFWEDLNSYIQLVKNNKIETKILGKLTRYGSGNSQELISIQKFIIPTLNSLENLSNEIEYYFFDECVFLDDFIIDLKLRNKYLNLDFDFSKSIFQGKLEFRGNSSGIDGNIKINSTKHYGDIKFEADYFKNIELSNINFNKVEKNKNLPLINIDFKPSLLLRHMKFDNIILSYFDDCNINKITFEYADIENLNFTKMKDKLSVISSFTMYNSFINKCYIANLNLNIFLLKDMNFKENAQIYFKNISTKNLTLNNIIQDAKNIELNNIEVKNNFKCSQVNFKNTTFNNFNLLVCETKNISNTIFTDSHLNSVKWGNINLINSDRETFRQLKSLNDEKSNYIDANNFFVKEMKEYKKELSQNKWFNWWEEKIIFFMNEQISNYGKSWFQSLLWLLIISIFFFNITEEIVKPTLLFQGLLTVFIFYATYKIRLNINKHFKNFKLPYVMPHILALIYLFLITDKSFFDSINDISHFINPASYDDYKAIGFSSIWALHKSLIAIVIYHFTISLRRQTKR